MIKKGRTKGTFKGTSQRSQRIEIRLTPDELKYIDALCEYRRSCGANLHSRADVIVLSVKFASGELTILERMEMNLFEGKSLFDAANFSDSNYTKWLKAK